MDTRKITGSLLSDNLKSIGVRGTAIRGMDFIVSRASEARILRKYVDKHILPAMSSDSIPVKKLRNESHDNTIWVCWFQGMENAPELVRMCFESLKTYNSDHEIIVLTDENIKTYIEFPGHISQKYQQGKIGRPHYSDLLRAAMIYCYGGIWVDATMLFTESIPEAIWNSDMFVFKFSPQESRYQVASSQFIRGHCGNEILRRTLVSLFDYWKKKTN